MACTTPLADIIGLDSDFPPSEVGTFTFEGWSTSPITSTSSQGGAPTYGPYSTFSAFTVGVGNTIPGGFTAEFDPGDGWSGFENNDSIHPYLGYWHINYTLGGCSRRIIIQILQPVCAGGNADFTFCAGDTTVVDLRTEFFNADPCNLRDTPSPFTDYTEASPNAPQTSVITDDDTINVTNPGTPYYITNPGVEAQKEWVDVDQITVDGTYSFTNTAQMNEAYQYGLLSHPCEDCTNSDSAVITITKFNSSAGNRRAEYTPYLVVCDNPSCAANLRGLVENESDGGKWYYEGIYSSGNQDDTPPGSLILLSTPGVHNVYASTSGGGGTYSSIAPGTQIGTTDTEQIFLDQADLFNIYTFSYRVNEGTLCEDITYVYVRTEQIGDAGTAIADVFDCYWPYFENNWPSEDPANFQLHNFLTGTPTDEGTWTATWISGLTSGTNQTMVDASLSNGDQGVNATFDFEALLGGYPSRAARIEFTFTSEPSTTSICPACPTDTESIIIDLGGNCDPGTSLYNSPTTPPPYQCAACTVDLSTLITGEDPCGRWYFTQVTGGGSNPVTLNVDGGGASSYSLNNVIGTDNNPLVDFSGATSGLYKFTYDTQPGITTTAPGGSTHSCVSSTSVWIQVASCEDCNQLVVVPNFEFLNYIEFDNGTVLNGSTPGFSSFPYYEGELSTFITEFDSYIPTNHPGCVTSESTYFQTDGKTLYLSLSVPTSAPLDAAGVDVSGSAGIEATFFDQSTCDDCSTMDVSISEVIDQETGQVTSLTASLDAGTCPGLAFYWEETDSYGASTALNGSSSYTVNAICTNSCLGSATWTCPACGATPTELNVKYFGIDYNPIDDVNTDLRLVSFEYWNGSSYTELITGGEEVVIDHTSYTADTAGDGDPYNLTDLVTALNGYASANDIHVYFSAVPDFVDADAADSDAALAHKYIRAHFPDCAIPAAWNIVLDVYYTPSGDIFRAFELTPSSLGIDASGGNTGPFTDYTTNDTAICSTCSDFPEHGQGIVIPDSPDDLYQIC